MKKPYKHVLYIQKIRVPEEVKEVIQSFLFKLKAV